MKNQTRYGLGQTGNGKGNGGGGRGGRMQQVAMQGLNAQLQALQAQQNAAQAAAAGGGGAAAPTGKGGLLSSSQQSAFDQMYALLDGFGLGSLSGTLKDLLLDGVTDAASIQLSLQETAQWKARFAGNEQLKAKGLGVLSPAEYLAVEKSYAQVMKNYGLPEGFYDDPADFAQFIGGNVSAAELQTRVQTYADIVNRDDPAMKQQLTSMGFTQGDILAYTMDPSRAAPLVQNKYQTAVLGSAARRAGVVADNSYLSDLADRGVTEQAASEGYGLIGGSLSDAQRLSGIYGEDYGVGDMQDEVFSNSSTAGKKRKRLASRERAAFGGSSGSAGAQRQSTSGSY